MFDGTRRVARALGRADTITDDGPYTGPHCGTGDTTGAHEMPRPRFGFPDRTILTAIRRWCSVTNGIAHWFTDFVQRYTHRELRSSRREPSGFGGLKLEGVHNVNWRDTKREQVGGAIGDFFRRENCAFQDYYDLYNEEVERYRAALEAWRLRHPDADDAR